VLFAVPHLIKVSLPLGARLFQVVLAASVGWLLAGVRLRAGSIVPAIALHALYNLTVGLAVLTAPSTRLSLPVLVVVVAAIYGTSLIKAFLTDHTRLQHGQAGDAVAQRSTS